MVVISSTIAVGPICAGPCPKTPKPVGEAGKALEFTFPPASADDLAWWIEAAKAAARARKEAAILRWPGLLRLSFARPPGVAAKVRPNDKVLAKQSGRSCHPTGSCHRPA